METEVNIPLLRKAVEWAEVEAQKPEIDCLWDQSDYITSPTIRAWRMTSQYVALDQGPLARRAERERLTKAVAPHCGTAYCIAGWVGQLLDPRYEKADDVKGMCVSEFAADALGLNPDQADELFEGSNTIGDVRRIAERIAGGAL